MLLKQAQKTAEVDMDLSGLNAEDAVLELQRHLAFTKCYGFLEFNFIANGSNAKGKLSVFLNSNQDRYLYSVDKNGVFSVQLK